jgi:hypothetical protein
MFDLHFAFHHKHKPADKGRRAATSLSSLADGVAAAAAAPRVTVWLVHFAFD